MIAVIKDFDARLFSFNGIKYYRNFLAMDIGDNIRIVNAYDTRFTLLNTHYNNVEVNGQIFGNIKDLISSLSELLFIKDVSQTQVPGEATNNTTNALFNNIFGTWINTPSSPVTGVINFDLSGAVNGGICAVYFKAAVLSFSGGTIIIKSGDIVPNELALIWIIYDQINAGFNVNIQTGFVDLPTDQRPNQMTITAIQDITGDNSPPAQMTITDITESDLDSPVQMTITDIVNS